jgi:hypothetical protein
MDIKEELKNIALSLRDNLTTRDQRKELHAQKRKLVAEELKKCQKL